MRQRLLRGMRILKRQELTSSRGKDTKKIDNVNLNDNLNLKYFVVESPSGEKLGNLIQNQTKCERTMRTMYSSFKYLLLGSKVLILEELTPRLLVPQRSLWEISADYS